jgi:hypothetical protein
MAILHSPPKPAIASGWDPRRLAFFCQGAWIVRPFEPSGNQLAVHPLGPEDIPAHQDDVPNVLVSTFAPNLNGIWRLRRIISIVAHR